MSLKKIWRDQLPWKILKVFRELLKEVISPSGIEIESFQDLKNKHFLISIIPECRKTENFLIDFSMWTYPRNQARQRNGTKTNKKLQHTNCTYDYRCKAQKLNKC